VAVFTILSIRARVKSKVVAKTWGVRARIVCSTMCSKNRICLLKVVATTTRTSIVFFEIDLNGLLIDNGGNPLIHYQSKVQ
jgi:hypothetical protein